jgi:Flp pilus assembly protein TadD
MIDPVLHLVPADLERLGERVVEWLGKIFTFSEWTFCPVYDHVRGLPPIRLSERQRQRAYNALSECKGFWDRIGQQILIPIRDHAAVPDHQITLGTMVLFKNDNSIGPEEAERWMPVLQSCIENRLEVLRLKSSFSRSGEIPPYAYLALEAICRKKAPSISLLHLKQKLKANAGHCNRETAVDLCSMLWRNCDSEWLGGNSRDSWILLPGVDKDELSCGLKQMISKARAFKIPISNAYGHHILCPFDIGLMDKDIYALERLAEELGVAVFCTEDQRLLEDRLGIEGLVTRLDQVKKAVRGKSKCAVAYVKPLPHDLRGPFGQGISLIPGEKDNAFLIKRFDTRPRGPDLARWGGEIQKLCTAARGGPSTIGIAAAGQPAVRHFRTQVAALWAFIHADLLGNGSVVVHDGVTWNVRGDEIFSWGDLSGACRSYRRGLQAEPSNANLLNSLGVCLAELGRTKEAIGAFSQAAATPSGNFMALYNLGGIYFKKGDLESAEKALKRAYELKPGDMHLAGRMAEVLIESDRAKEALEILAPFAGRPEQPLPGAIFRILGKAYQALNQWKKAKTSWQQAIKKNHEDSESMALLALGYLEEINDRETASKLKRQAEVLGNRTKQTRTILERLNRKLNPLDLQK